MDQRKPEEKGEMTLRYAAALDARRTIFSTGSAAVDSLLGGGLRTGEVVEVFGASNSGKTQLGMQATLAPVAAGYSAAFVDTEGTFRPERLALMAEVRGMNPERALANVFFVRAETTAQQLEAIRNARKLEHCRMVIVDTVTKNFTLEYAGPKMMARRQTELGAYLNRLARDAYSRDRAVLLTNRVASVGGPGAPSREVSVGGSTLSHGVQKALHLTRRGGQIGVSLVTDGAGRELLTRLTERGME